MPDGRFVSRGISQSEQLAAASFEADYLFGRCIPHLDRDGRMSGHPALVKSQACPLRKEITEAMIPDLLRTLAGLGLVKWYEADGKQVLEFPKFRLHQKGMKYEREAESRFPPSTYDGSIDLGATYSGGGPDQVPPKVSEVKVSEVEEQPLVELPVPATSVVPVNGGRPRTFGAIKDHLSGVLDDVREGRIARLKADEMRTIQAELVFAYWQVETGHERAILDDKRLNRLKRCLKENSGDVHELLYAVDGWRKDPTFKGLADKENRVLDGIENIFTDRARIERLAGHCADRRKNKPHRMAVKYLEAAQPNGDGAADA
jgi:hypothetical protein